MQNLVLVEIDEAQNLLLVQGSVPGARNGYVVIRNAKKKAGMKVKLKGQGEAEVKSKNPMKASKAGAGSGQARRGKARQEVAPAPLSKLRDRSHRHDVFHRRAKQQGFVARSVFKLEEIDQKHSCSARRARARPRLPAGLVAAVRGQDRRARTARWSASIARRSTARSPGARILVGDVFAVTPAELRGALAAFDVVLSDMAPDTSGVRSLDQARSEGLFERALEIAELTLRRAATSSASCSRGPTGSGCSSARAKASPRCARSSPPARARNRSSSTSSRSGGSSRAPEVERALDDAARSAR